MFQENELKLEVQKPVRFVVDFWPTGRCDMTCPFCYGADVPIGSITQAGPDRKTNRTLLYSVTPETVHITRSEQARPEMTLDQMKKVVSMLKEIGVDTLNIGGGEPLIRPETPALIRFAHQIGLEVYLSTNGTFLKRHYDQVKDSISVLGLPLDGSTSEMNVFMGRREYLYQNIINILTFFRNYPPTHRVKVGTVVSGINIEDIAAIGRFLYRNPDLYHPDVWRIYQFEPLKEGAKNRNMYEISDSEFEKICEDLRDQFPEATISSRSNTDHSNAYFFVTPDGMIQTVGTKHESIVDLLVVGKEDLASIVAQHRDTQFKASKNREWIPR